MRIAIVGAGRVGRALGARWSEIGHDVVYGVREPTDHTPLAMSCDWRAPSHSTTSRGLPWGCGVSRRLAIRADRISASVGVRTVQA